jgi:carbonic anhydrase
MSGGITEVAARQNGRVQRPVDAPSRPRTGVAVLTCMDARLDVYRILGLIEGDAHVIRNAGGIVTSDARLALAVSQHLMDTREILVLHHLDCAMRRVHDHELAAAVAAASGSRPPWRFATTPDPRTRVEEAVRLIAGDPYLSSTAVVRGFLYDERTDTLEDVCRSVRPVG